MKVAVCLIVRDEAGDLPEWIAYHTVIGFDTLIIFDNCSTDGTAEVIRAAARRHDIRYHHWTRMDGGAQMAAYAAAVEAYRLEFTWIAVLDADEFLVPGQQRDVKKWLERFEGWTAVGVHWTMFGSSGLEDSRGQLVTQSFLHRARPEFPPTRHVKSIIRPYHCGGPVNAHAFHMEPGPKGAYCDAAGRPIAWLPVPQPPGVLAGVTANLPDYQGGQLNHYFTRSRAHWQARLRRGTNQGPERLESEFLEYDRNEVRDDWMLCWGEELQSHTALLRADYAPNPADAVG